MSGPLRYRVPLTVLVVFLLLAGGLVRLMRYGVMRAYTVTERRNVATDVRRADAALDTQEEALRVIVGGRAAWDDTYAFMDGHSSDYISQNLNDETLRNLGVDAALFIDLEGRVGFSRAVGGAEVPRDVSDAARTVAARIAGAPDGMVSGKLRTSAGPAILAAAAIRSGTTAAPVRGVLVFVKYVREEEVAAIARIALLDVKVRPPRSAGETGSADDVVDTVYVEPVDARTVSGRLTLAGLDGAPALRIVVTEEREELLDALDTLYYLSWALFGFVLLAGAAMWVMLEVTVLSRLTLLHREVSGIGTASTAPREVGVRGHDEIGDVARAINTMLDRIRHAEDALRHAAEHDYLTGLANRRAFERNAVRELAERERFGGSCAVLLLDLDDFKIVNDTYGHLCGDGVLAHFAEILESITRSYSTVARLGGDEFAVLMPHTDRVEALVAIERLRERLASADWECADSSLSVTASVGYAVSPEDGITLDELIAAADGMLYSWKTQK